MTNGQRPHLTRDEEKLLEAGFLWPLPFRRRTWRQAQGGPTFSGEADCGWDGEDDDERWTRPF